MSSGGNHIVHRLNLQIDVSDEHTARRMYREAGALLQQYVWPQLEALLQQYGREEAHLRLETLNVNLQVPPGVSVTTALREELSKAIAASLKKTLKEDLPDEKQGAPITKPVFRSGAEQLTEAFLFFLENGVLPWWYASASGSILDTTLLTEAIATREQPFAGALLQRLQQNAVRERLLRQCDTPLLVYLYSLLVPLELFTEAHHTYEGLQLRIPGSGQPAKQEMLRQYWIMVWRLYPVAGAGNATIKDFKKKLQALDAQMEPGKQDSNTVGKLEPDDPKDNSARHISVQHITMAEDMAVAITGVDAEERTVPEDKPVATKPEDAAAQKLPEAQPLAEGEYWLANAGLVLLHPFLQYFFAGLGLMQDMQFVDHEARSTAVHLLHYLASGEEQAPDFDLVMEKYICGMPVTDCTDRFILLSRQMKEEATVLLRSVTGHWKALKSTSEEGLQQAFLQRKGKLILTENKHSLVLEQLAQDILLEQIPWNISLVKLPWLPQLLHVEWLHGG